MTHVDISRDRLERLKSMGVADYLHMALLNRIEELEAKLAKAVDALRFYGSICADKDKSPWNVYSEDFGSKARAALAEINGGGDT